MVRGCVALSLIEMIITRDKRVLMLVQLHACKCVLPYAEIGVPTSLSHFLDGFPPTHRTIRSVKKESRLVNMRLPRSRSEISPR
jgi:hypothetical protein